MHIYILSFIISQQLQYPLFYYSCGASNFLNPSLLSELSLNFPCILFYVII